MADNEKHIKPTADLIRRYLAGELDDRTMHALEKQALDDPLLADALEGYAQYPDQSAAVADLRSRLEERLRTGEKDPAIPVAPAEKGKIRRLDYRWVAAAVVLVILTAGGLLLLNRGPQVQDIAQVPKADTSAAADTGLVDGAAMAKAQDSQAAAADSPVAPSIAKNTPAAKAENPAAAKPGQTRAHTPEITLDKASGEKVAAVYKKELLKAKTAPPPSASKSITIGYAPAPARQQTVTVRPPLQAKRKLTGSINVDTFLIGRARTDSSFAAYNAEIAKRKALAQGNKVEGIVGGAESKYRRYSEENDLRILSGRVVDAESGERIIGANIRVQGSDKAAVTDTAGNFALSVEPNKKLDVSVSYVGYEPANVAVASNESSLDVRLAGRASGLSEVVIAQGVSGKKPLATPPAARPLYGDSAYRKYLESIKTVPVKGLQEKVSGEVEISFTVMPDGSLKNFKAQKPFHEAAGKAAIKHVEEGPEWLPASNGKKSTVRLKVPVELISEE